VPEEPFNAAQIGLQLAAALETAAIPYAIGGALAYGVWALPRATKDVDLNVFVAADLLPDALDVLAQTGVVFNREEALRQASEEGLLIGWVGACRIDVFTPSIPFSWEALKTRVSINVGGRSAWFLSAEALSFFKMMFFRGKDIVDLERLVSGMGKALDAAYVRRWLVETMGEQDERVRKWDELCAALGPDAGS
jgi:hypothetical protein